MGNRSWEYLKKKQKAKQTRRTIIEFNHEVRHNLDCYGMAGTRVWKDENGNVQMKVLSLKEMLDFNINGGDENEISFVKL